MLTSSETVMKDNNKKVIPSDRRSVLINARGYLIAHILGHAYVFLTIPILKRYLSPAEFGYYTLIVSMISIIQIGGITLVSNALYKFYVEYKGLERRIFLGNIFFGMLVIQLLLSTAVFLIRDPFVIWLYPNLTLPLDPYVPLAMVWLIMTSIKVLCMTTLKIKELPGLMFQFVFYYGISIVLLIALLVVRLNLGLTGALLAFILAELSTQLLVGRKIWTEASIAWRPEQLRKAFIFSGPLVVGSIAFIVAQNLDRVVLSRFVNLDLVGDYGVGVMLGSVAGLIATSFTPSYTARVLKILEEGDKERARKVLGNAFTDGTLIIGSFIILLLISVDVVGTILAGSESVVVVGRVATCIALSHFVRFMFLFSQNVLYMTGKSLAIMKINLLLVMIVGVTNVFLANMIGPLWVACSIGTAYVILFVPVLLVANKEIRLVVPVNLILLVVGSAFLVIGCQEWIYSQGFSLLSPEYWGGKLLEFLLVAACMGSAVYRRFGKSRIVA